MSDGWRLSAKVFFVSCLIVKRSWPASTTSRDADTTIIICSLCSRKASSFSAKISSKYSEIFVGIVLSLQLYDHMISRKRYLIIRITTVYGTAFQCRLLKFWPRNHVQYTNKVKIVSKSFFGFCIHRKFHKHIRCKPNSYHAPKCIHGAWSLWKYVSIYISLMEFLWVYKKRFTSKYTIQR